MMGMEKMLASMIGLTPEQMQAMIVGIQNAATNGVAALETIVQQNAQILAKLERLENERENHGS
jgi:hypothetical protein